MADIVIQINKRLDIVMNGKYYKSSVQDLSANYIAIAAPMMMGGVFLPLHKGDTFKVIYYVDDKELYEFDGIVVGVKFEERIRLVIIEYPKTYKQVQRREYVRVEVIHPIKYVRSVINEDLKQADKVLDEDKGKNALLMDISGGGLRLKTSEKMESGNLVTVDIDLLDRHIRVRGKLMRIVKDEFDNYLCGVCFIEINERLRDRIIQLIFEIMRKQLKTV
jgi:c-di-GMP-binding flagellar brake protein YcgR